MLKMRLFRTLAVLVLATLLTGAAQAEVTMDLVFVGNVGNEADHQLTGDYGAVAYGYGIGKFEVTTGQYLEFLNAVAADDTYDLYSPSMGGTGPHRTGIVQSGSPTAYTYSLEAGYDANRPVSFVCLKDAYRFSNWMENGQPTGAQNADSTEDGSYTITGDMIGQDWYNMTRNPGSSWAIPTEHEWYKAAYHKNDGVTGNYWDYPCGSDDLPSNLLEDPDGGNNATYYDVFEGTFTLLVNGYGSRTVVGEHENSASPYGTFDQGGNVVELHEANGNYLIGHGGGYAQNWDTLQASFRMYFQYVDEYLDFGFRVVDLSYVESFPGDANADNKVDELDAQILADNWLASSGVNWGQGDFNDDGVVDGADATIMATNWHWGVPASVPEPAAIVLLVGGLLCLLAIRRGRLN